ncbi:MAG TPA: TylF/MycF/NovP-related O-methyltransferase [Gemmatimonadaceae bacterium]|nr:TylF/MycF/NovP-related O-methyltransferase [Gemmatimonadaceae bacterium]
MRLRALVKRMLVHSPIPYSERTDALVRLSLLKSWIARYKPHPYFGSRAGLFSFVAGTGLATVPITFLEFGVFKGASIHAWTTLNTANESEFIGFDSFEGLPEAWVNVGKTFPPGAFSTRGSSPVLGDQRVRFVKGWFRQTLPPFLSHFSTEKPLVVHCDADLYSSTLFVLCKLDAVMKPGTVVMFDDFTSMLHDFRAWEDYTRAFGREYEVLGAAGHMYYEHVAMRITQ